MFKQSIFKVAALTGLFLLLPLTAIGEILSMDEAVEADNIVVGFNGGSPRGTASVSGCTGCPLELSVDGNTQFFHNNERVERQQIRSLSGRSGTVTYNAEKQHATKILW